MFRFISITQRNIIPHIQPKHWKFNNIKRKNDFVNIDNCGDNFDNNISDIHITKDFSSTIKPYNETHYKKNSIENIVSDYNRRWKQSLSTEEFKQQFYKMK